MISLSESYSCIIYCRIKSHELNIGDSVNRYLYPRLVPGKLVSINTSPICIFELQQMHIIVYWAGRGTELNGLTNLLYRDKYIETGNNDPYK